jgi:hypothetical protein
MSDLTNSPTPQWKLKIKELVTSVSNAMISELQTTGNLFSEALKTAYVSKTKDISDAQLAQLLRMRYDVKSNVELVEKLNDREKV